ncbi:MAG TPA: aspartyl/asparaginyl beta-hydroxylase domain-containing protein [Woeseiaceae bacterium]|nr:aspartyl/asparaginyl beta-hydroxylase domain-containing protein [Woeseiaceae bacterium]
MEIARPFIRLPYAFDADRLAEEVAALPDAAWMTHPAGFPGNSALPLISRNGGSNEDFHGVMQITPHLECSPYLQQAMASFGEVLGRSRLMKLAGGAQVATHVDFNYHWYTRVRVHIPIVTHPSVRFFCADAELHMRPGECWIFNSWRRHRVVNGSAAARVHLVIDIAGSSRFWAGVAAMERFDPVADREAIDAQVRAVPFDPAATPPIRAERYNVSPVMAPGEVDALVKELIGDFSRHPKNEPRLVESYRELLLGFARDWREAWHLYGYRERGWPRYRAAIERVQAQLHPDNRALVTASNEVGVNPIIVQRILRAALVTDQFDDFAAAFGDGSG